MYNQCNKRPQELIQLKYVTRTGSRQNTVFKLTDDRDSTHSGQNILSRVSQVNHFGIRNPILLIPDFDVLNGRVTGGGRSLHSCARYIGLILIMIGHDSDKRTRSVLRLHVRTVISAEGYGPHKIYEVSRHTSHHVLAMSSLRERAHVSQNSSGSAARPRAGENVTS
jgi:hypothetical protein